MKGRIIREGSFYRQLLLLALPIAVQNLITQAVGVADSIMLGFADKSGTLLSASSLANQPFFILSLVCFGLSSGSAVLCSQYWGKGDRESIRTVISMILKVALAISALFSLFVLVFPENVMRLFSSNALICEMGAEYLRIVGFAYLIFGFGYTLLCSIRSVELVRVSVVVNASSFFINVFLNWVLIFGKLGAPALGIRGAAIATLVARITEFVITVIYVFVIDKRLAFRVRHLFRFDRTLATDLLRHATPVLLNELMWSLAISTQAAILGHITYAQGDPVAANAVAGMVQQLATVFIIGLGNASAVMVGKAIGEGRRDEAMRRAYTLTFVSILVGVFAFVLIMLLQAPILSLYSLEADTMLLARRLIFVVAVVAAFSSPAATLIMGVLRGAGDTRFCLIGEMACLWGVAIPAALVGAYVFHLPVPLVLCLMKLDEALKVFICLIRMKGGRFMRTLTRDRTLEKASFTSI